jgi:hypothetical protein
MSCRIDYYAYLKSPEWAVRRQWKLEAAENRCQLCDATDRLQVHHRTYERLGKERIADLIVLCERCHRKFHDIYNKPPRSVVPAPSPSRPAMRLGAERNLVLLVLRQEKYLCSLTSRLSPGAFRTPIYAEIIAALVDVSASSESMAWTGSLSNDASLAVQDMLGDPEGLSLANPDRFFEENVRAIESREQREALPGQVTLIEAKRALRRRIEADGAAILATPKRKESECQP